MAGLGRVPISIKVMDVTETTEKHLVLHTAHVFSGFVNP